MIISHSKCFILMSPWKSASSTCHLSLKDLNENPYPRLFHFNSFLNRVVHQHITLSELLALPEGKLGYKIATFVRNPYDRAYSGFSQIQRDFETQPKIKFDPTWIDSLVKAQIIDNMNRIITAGFDFDEWIKLLPDYEFFEIGRNSNMPLHPCHYWTHLNNTQVAGFIGKVEYFTEDFHSFCDYVNIQDIEIISSNITEHKDKQAAGYSKYASRMSRRTIDRINDIFAEDFNIFRYTML